MLLDIKFFMGSQFRPKIKTKTDSVSYPQKKYKKLWTRLSQKQQKRRQSLGWNYLTVHIWLSFSQKFEIHNSRHWLCSSLATTQEVWFSASWGTKEAENVFLTHGWEYGLEYMGGLRSCEKFKVHFAFAIRHCPTPSHPPMHGVFLGSV